MAVELLIGLARAIGHWPFLALLAVVVYFLCFIGIPRTADWMVNASAGLAGKYFGRRWRTLAVNASTNNPELFSMVVAFAMLRIGGIANPLGSNFANIYLMYLVAPMVVVGSWKLRGEGAKVGDFFRLLAREKGIVLWHVTMAIVLFGCSSLAYWLLTGQLPIGGGGGGVGESEAALTTVPSFGSLAIAAAASFASVVFFLVLMGRLNRQRPELTDDIDSSEHTESWLVFAVGTTGLIACVWLMNVIFETCAELYGGALSAVLGDAVFAGLHYFLGALVTSLPELKVAIDNYRRQTSPDLNTALASASMSNMTNMAIALLGVVVAMALIGLWGDAVRV